MDALNHAAFQDEPRGDFSIRPTDMPTTAAGEIVVKVARTALNHIDRRIALEATFPVSYPAILGACISGVVTAVGPAGSDRFAVGDRVASYTAYYSKKDHKDNRYGAFQEYVLTKELLTVKLPDGMDLASAASMIASAPLATVALTEHLGLLGPTQGENSAKSSLLCLGASTSIGGFIVQLASQAGHRVIGTTSARNQDYVRRLGASEALDYHLNYLLLNLEAEGPFDAVIDCVSTPETVSLAAKVIRATIRRDLADGQAPETLSWPTIFTVLPVPNNENGEFNVPTKFMWLAAPFAMEEKVLLMEWLFHELLQSKLDQGQLMPTPPKVLERGLDELADAMMIMQRVSAQKVVLSLDSPT